MITPLLLSAALFARQAAPAPTTAAGLISKMLARYHSAKTLQGTIKTVQSAQNVSITTITNVAYERPSRILIDQKQGGPSPRSSLLISDGKKFMYSWPDRLLSEPRYFTEDLKHPDQASLTIDQLYPIIAANLPDRSAVLDLLIGRVDDMKNVSAQFSSFSLKGKAQIAGRTANAIKGDWREDGMNTSMTKSAVGQFELYLTDDGELLRYVLRQNFGVPAPAGSGGPVQSVEVTNTWDATVALNAPVSPDVFALRPR